MNKHKNVERIFSPSYILIAEAMQIKGSAFSTHFKAFLGHYLDETYDFLAINAF